MSYEVKEKSAPEARELAQHLRSLIIKMKRRMREELDADDFTPSQTAEMIRLDQDGPATNADLARAEAMRPQSMGAIIAALEANGLVGRARVLGMGGKGARGILVRVSSHSARGVLMTALSEKLGK